jgi:uncharacterized protein YjiS (DUF1127 family)
MAISLVPTFRSPRAVAATPFLGLRKAAGTGKLLRLLRLWFERRAWRSELAALDAEQMRDCGFNPLDVRREAAKPFWRA